VEAIFTIGHSTRPIASFLRLLAAHRVDRVIDIRVSPTSAHNPQYAQPTLRTALRAAGIRYLHLKGLGGHRRPRRDSPNGGWRHASFRGYADYMQTPAFARSLDRVLDLAADERVALMCAEGVPWRCHRSLVADALLVHGVVAEEIASGVRATPHRLTSFAVAHGGTLVYPPTRTAAPRVKT
jgi:uncharacterized protein (DUF488 family)